VTASGLHLIDVSNLSKPTRIGGTSPGHIGTVALSGNFACTLGQEDLRIYDVSNPSRIQKRSSLSLSDGHEISVAGGIACIACGTNGLVFVDVSNPDAPVRLGSVRTRGVAHCVVVRGHLAYVADGLAGLTVVDLGTLQFCRFSASNGAFHTQLLGMPGIRVVLESSFDLSVWTPWQTNMLPTGGLPLSIPMGTNLHQFFKARIP